MLATALQGAEVVKEAVAAIVVGLAERTECEVVVIGIVGTEASRRWEGRARHLQQLVLAMAGRRIVWK